MYKPGDDKLEVRELLDKAFASAWEAAAPLLTEAAASQSACVGMRESTVVLTPRLPDAL